MTNHVHLLITPETSSSAGVLMKKLGQRYVQYINRENNRGHLTLPGIPLHLIQRGNKTIGKTIGDRPRFMRLLRCYAMPRKPGRTLPEQAKAKPKNENKRGLSPIILVPTGVKGKK